MATKLKVPKKESQESAKEEKEEHKPIPKEKGPVEYPEDHKPGMRVPVNGSSCLTCEYYKGNDLCGNEYFKKWNRSEKLPYPAEEYCSDWYEIK